MVMVASVTSLHWKRLRVRWYDVGGSTYGSGRLYQCGGDNMVVVIMVMTLVLTVHAMHWCCSHPYSDNYNRGGSGEGIDGVGNSISGGIGAVVLAKERW